MTRRDDGLVDAIRMAIPAMLPGFAERIADSVAPFITAAETDRDALRVQLAERDATIGRVEALPDEWETQSRDWYYANRYDHPSASSYEDGWDHAADLLRAALARPDAAPLLPDPTRCPRCGNGTGYRRLDLCPPCTTALDNETDAAPQETP